MRKVLGAVFLAAFLGGAAPGGAATWYVAPVTLGGNDANPGTLAQPFYTFWPATSAAQPGDTIYVRGGTYAYSTGQWIACSGTASAWITLSAYPGETPVIDGSSMPASQYALGIGGQYLVLKGFTVQNAPNGIGSWEEGHLRILENTVSGGVSWGIYCGAATFGNNVDILIDGNRSYNNVQENNPPCPNCGWAASISTYFAQGVTVSHNVSYNNFGEGIGISHSDNVCVVGNTSYDNYSVEIYLDNDRYCTVGGNLAYSTFNSAYYRYGYPSIGIACANENFTPWTNPLDSDVIVNNVVINSRYGFDYGNFQNGGGMKNFIVANNTFYGAPDTLLQIDPDPGHAGNLIANNVFYQTGGNAMESMGGPVSAFSFSHNAWYGGSPGACAGVGDVALNPLLLNPGTDNAADYAPLPGSPLVDGATAVAAVTADYAGTLRPQGAAYDIGAFEALQSPTATPTPTAAPCTDSQGHTCTPTPSPTPTSTPGATGILFPNPVRDGTPLRFDYDVTGPVREARVKIFTPAYRKVFEDDGLSASPGWHEYVLDWDRINPPLANGLYYVVLELTDGSRETRQVMKLLLQR